MKSFSTSISGYNKEEVNSFVSDVIKQVEGMIQDLKDKDKEILSLKESLEKYKLLEESLNKTIMLAEDSSSQLRKLAKDESENIIKEAKRNASRIVNDALMEAEKIQKDNEQLKRNIIAFKRRMKSMLESQMDLVDDMEHLDI